MSDKANVITLHSGDNKKASFLWSPRKGVSAAWRVGAQPAVLEFTGVERGERPEERASETVDAATLTERAVDRWRPSAAMRRKYERLLGAETWTKAEINAATKLINSMRHESNGSKRRDWIESWMWAAERTGCRRRITPEHARQGLEYLQRIAFRRDGARRNTKDYPFGAHELHVLRNFLRFEFAGWYRGDAHGRYSPVWRAIARDGLWFEYTNARWAMPRIIDSGNSREERTGARSESLARAISLYEQEHGDCGQNTCDCSVAYRLGHLRLAMSAERDSMCREEHLDCPQCGAVLWLPSETDYSCDACGHRIVDQINEV